MCEALQLKSEPWTLQQIVTAAIAALGIVVSTWSLLRTRRLNRQQLRLHTKQEELIDLQLQALRRESTPAPVTEKADVRVDLEGSGGNYKFVVTNWGRVPARDVTFDLDVKPGSVSPLATDYEDKIPIPILAPGSRCALSAALTFGTGTTFQARWTWYNPDGTRSEMSSQLAI
jgi:hypothetical protein